MPVAVMRLSDSALRLTVDDAREGRVQAGDGACGASVLRTQSLAAPGWLSEGNQCRSRP
jgi:hypothetical protein